ncbi:hypothetical protein EV648_11027 [Kribbella sp. VKM Ac-2568]|nr:hypothetical protein EV648_11027 [Kribbella sp. VKM Ac-2568]
MADKSVDLGAQFVAVLTVGAVPLVDDGAWSWLVGVGGR